MNRPAALAASALLAVASAWLLWLGVTRKDRERLAADEPVEVVAAERDIAPGVPLTRADIEPVGIPRRALAPTTVLKSHGGDLLGQSLVRARRKGEQISWFDVAEHGRGLASAIPAGERAVTIGVDERSGLSGMLKPSDRVDVLLVGRQDSPKEGVPDRPFARLLLPNVTVLAVGARTGLDALGEAEGYSTVTLACTPEEAAALALAQSQGELVLVLRNPEDQGGMEAGAEVDLEAILSGRAGSELARKRRERVEVIRGGKP